LRALLVHGSNVVVSAPDAARVRAGLESLDLLVVCDFFFSETAAFADVVLPVTQWAEEEGTMTSLEGRVLRRRRAIDPPAGVRSELWILHELAERLDAPGNYSVDAAEVFAELARASEGGPADYSGLSHELLDTGVAAFWPFPVGGAGTPRMFLDAFAHPDGKARLVPVQPGSRATPAQRDGTMTLITGRLLGQYQSGTQTRRVPELLAAHPVAEAELHPAAAVALGLADGDDVELFNARGTVRCRVKLSADIRYDTVFQPFHYAGGESANLLTESATDPISGMPEFKSTVVEVRAVRASPSAEPVMAGDRG
jgi:assimilatory nitrate reductase catalytic subunit